MTYIGEPVFLDSLLFEPENSLIRQSQHANYSAITTNGDGFGVGWYGGRQTPGLYREVLPAWNDFNLRNLAHQLSSEFFFAHVRASTGTETSCANCHPFRSGKWLFMHNGVIGGYQKIRRDLERLIPDSHYHNRTGTTDSELFFNLMFGFGIEDDPAQAFSETIGAILKVMKQSGVDEPFRMTAALADGHTLYALRYSSNPEPPSLFWWPSRERLLIVSEPLDADGEHWREVPESHMLVSEGHGDTAVLPFHVAA